MQQIHPPSLLGPHSQKGNHVIRPHPDATSWPHYPFRHSNDDYYTPYQALEVSKKWCGHYLSFCAFWALFLVIIDPIISVATNIYSHLMHTFPIWHMTTHPLLIWTESHTNSHFWKGPPYFTSAIVEMNALSNSICSRNGYMVWCPRIFSEADWGMPFFFYFLFCWMDTH